MGQSLFDEFLADPRVKKAKAALIDVYKEYQEKLDKRKPTVDSLVHSGRTPTSGSSLADDAKAKKSSSASKTSLEGAAFIGPELKEGLARLEAKKGGAAFMPYLGSGLGSGSLVELSDGRVIYDFISGIGAHYSHGQEGVVGTLIDASFQDLVNQGNLQQNAGAVELMEMFSEASGLDHCFLTTSGAMAAENALKVMFQKHQPAHRILAFEGCFMGRTYLLSQVTDKPAFREGLPTQVAVDYIPFYDANDHDGSIATAVGILKKYLTRYPGQYAAMCFELIQGEGGYYPGHRDFFVALMDELKKENVGILIDEIQSFGRTTELFAFQEFNLQSYVDVVCVGKLSQVCATLFNANYAPKPGLLSQTFTGATSVIESAKYVLRDLMTNGYTGKSGKNMAVRKRFIDHLERLRSNMPEVIEGPYGSGTMIACTVFKGNKEKTMAFMNKLFEHGVLCFVAGRAVTRLRFLVAPGSVTNQEIDDMFAIFERTLRSMAA